ncbi:hypothetical protein STIAU_7359 [Stigmatella aurantiaca DW4/3-1]|uniref:Uncharacterized protein n=1 Tax=Stigmatella aurantiaca (strain DW4/3-1) TaxID=378806 RepID=Q099X8_STIAD|nr:hypothetical protein STIAU_7359 [Stigmatella aurantiaca DW4/3-1]
MVALGPEEPRLVRRAGRADGALPRRGRLRSLEPLHHPVRRPHRLPRHRLCAGVPLRSARQRHGGTAARGQHHPEHRQGGHLLARARAGGWRARGRADLGAAFADGPRGAVRAAAVGAHHAHPLSRPVPRRAGAARPSFSLRGTATAAFEAQGVTSNARRGSCAEGLGHEGGAAVHPELVEDALHVGFHRLQRAVEGVGDGFVLPPAQHAARHFRLSRGEYPPPGCGEGDGMGDLLELQRPPPAIPLPWQWNERHPQVARPAGALAIPDRPCLRGGAVLAYLQGQPLQQLSGQRPWAPPAGEPRLQQIRGLGCPHHLGGWRGHHDIRGMFLPQEQFQEPTLLLRSAKRPAVAKRIHHVWRQPLEEGLLALGEGLAARAVQRHPSVPSRVHVEHHRHDALQRRAQISEALVHRVVLQILERHHLAVPQHHIGPAHHRLAHEVLRGHFRVVFEERDRQVHLPVILGGTIRLGDAQRGVVHREQLASAGEHLRDIQGAVQHLDRLEGACEFTCVEAQPGRHRSDPPFPEQGAPGMPPQEVRLPVASEAYPQGSTLRGGQARPPFPCPREGDTYMWCSAPYRRAFTLTAPSAGRVTWKR